jgi:hypothetical protein
MLGFIFAHLYLSLKFGFGKSKTEIWKQNKRNLALGRNPSAGPFSNSPHGLASWLTRRLAGSRGQPPCSRARTPFFHRRVCPSVPVVFFNRKTRSFRGRNSLDPWFMPESQASAAPHSNPSACAFWLLRLCLVKPIEETCPPPQAWINPARCLWNSSLDSGRFDPVSTLALTNSQQPKPKLVESHAKPWSGPL